MENYDLNIHWGIKTIKVTFQIGKYKGYVTYRVKGNTKGASLLRVDADDLYNMTFVDNNAQLKDLGDEWYSMVLKGEHGEELIDEGEWDDLSDYIVAVEIIDMVSEEDWSTNDGYQGGKVMKIVLNKCFGGFGLSHEAKMEIFKRKNIEVFPYINNCSYDSDDEYTRHTGQKLGSMDFIYYFKKDPKIDKVTGIYSEIDRLYGIADDSSFSSDSNRGDKDLVAVVEKLGSEASGPHASLKVVDIPDGAEWEISDYDGIETAHYGFQIGSI